MTKKEIKKLLEKAEKDFRFFMARGYYASALNCVYRLQDDLGGLEGGVYLPRRSWTGFKNKPDHPEGMVPRTRLLKGGFHKLFTEVILLPPDFDVRKKRTVRIRE